MSFVCLKNAMNEEHLTFFTQILIDFLLWFCFWEKWDHRELELFDENEIDCDDNGYMDNDESWYGYFSTENIIHELALTFEFIEKFRFLVYDI